MFHIKTFNNIAIQGLKEFDEDNYTLNESSNPDGIILRSHDLHNMGFPENLKAIARAGAGTNNVPVDRCSKQGIVVFNTPGGNANAVKELVLAAMITTSRHMFSAKNWADQLEGPDLEEQVESGKKKFKGSELAGKTMGVIGLGAIGHLVANDAYRLGMKVVGFDPFLSVETAWKISRHVHKAASIEEVFQKADYITLHVPLTEENHHLIDNHAIKVMKNDAVLMNFSRAELVNTDEVIKALDRNVLGNYVTDFPETNLLEHDDCIVFPHLGASTEESEKNCAIMAARQLKRFLETGEITNSVNLPEVQLNFTSPLRIAIVNLNIPNMIGKLSNHLAERNINIDRIINKSRGDYAYTLVDTPEIDAETLESILADLSGIDGILQARVIRNKNKSYYY